MSLRRNNKLGAAVGTRGGATSSSSSSSALGASKLPTPPALSLLFDNAPNWLYQKTNLFVNLAGFAISLCFPTVHIHVDLLGTGAFALGALPGLWKSCSSSAATTTATAATAAATTRHLWTSAAVVAWSVKLASFLFYRVIVQGHDARLDDILADPYYCAGFWTYSAIWGIACALPYSLGMASQRASPPLALYAGMGTFVTGWLVETIADAQKWHFKHHAPHSSASEFCNVGLWSLSQHPNWFGNLLLWTGILVMNAPALIEPTASATTKVGAVVPASALGRFGNLMWRSRRLLLALVGPAFMLHLFTSQATGKLVTEGWEATRAKYGYGTNPLYTDYVDNTPLIFPNPLKWFS